MRWLMICALVLSGAYGCGDDGAGGDGGGGDGSMDGSGGDGGGGDGGGGDGGGMDGGGGDGGGMDGGGGDGGGGDGGGGGCTVIECQGHIRQCGDCMDNDGDGLIDQDDDDCLGPCDNNEDNYYAAIPGSPPTNCSRDCYFDQDDGSGNDTCRWDFQCDPLEPGPARCMYSDPPPPSASCPDPQTSTCHDVCAAGPGNAWTLADTPFLDRLSAEAPVRGQVRAHGTAVGMPSDDDMGNSEVGHNALGAGRVFDQGAKLVDAGHRERARSFEGEAWRLAVAPRGRRDRCTCMGLLSDGNVHSHVDHLLRADRARPPPSGVGAAAGARA